MEGLLGRETPIGDIGVADIGDIGVGDNKDNGFGESVEDVGG
jgi:hypothetical protein